MTEEPTRRSFSRFSIDFLAEVSGLDREGEPFTEKNELRDISGGGAKFHTRMAQRYYAGQPLDMNIFLPGTEELKANLAGRATVVRVEGSGVAVRFDEPLSFEKETLG